MTSLSPSQTEGRRVAFRRCAAASIAVAALCFAHSVPSMQRLTLSPSGFGGPSDQMGRSVALIGDTAAVGAPETQVNGVGSGTVDVYRLQNGTWAPEATLLPSNPTQNQQFGFTVTLGQDLLVAGGGTLYTFERTGTTWQQVDELAVPGFSEQIGLSGDTLVAAGTVYIRSGSGWQVQAALQPDDPSEFFTAAAIDGDLIAASTVGFGLDPPHAVYFFSRSGTTWTREGRIDFMPSFTTITLAVSGNTALIGAQTSASNNVSSVRVFDRDGSGQWIDHGTLDAGTDFTGEVPVAIEGNTALVGSYSDYTAYTFERSGDTWTRVLHFNDPNAHCFASVALSGSTALAGCPNSYTASGGYGTAAIFSLDATPPPVLAEFGQGDAQAGVHFGWHAVADEDTVLVTADSGIYFYAHGAAGWTQANAFANPPTNVMPGSVALDGATAAVAYPLQIYPGGTSEINIYARSGTTWALQSVIPGPPPDQAPYFGGALAMRNDVLVVSELDPSSSECHVFHRAGADWQAEADIDTPGVSGDYFCWSLAMSADTLLVGAPAATVGIETYAGAVYVFVRSGSAWVLQSQLLAPLVATRAGFGTSVAIEGDTAVVGSNNDTAPFDSTRGEVNVYRRSGTTWSWQATLMPPGSGNAPGDYGYAVAISATQDRILATAQYDLTHDPYAGVAFAFAFDGAQWSPSSTLHASPPFPPATNDQFGNSAAFSGDQFVIGAPGDGVGGAVYIGATSEAIFANGFDPAQ